MKARYKKIVKKERGDDKKIDYPVSLNFRSNWGEWEAVRELVTNAVDSGGKVTLRYHGEELIIKDDGSGIELHHLLMGEGESDGIKTIGKFREGMKIAIVVLLRLGCGVVIRTNGLVLLPEVNKMFGRDTLRIRYRETVHQDGTEVLINGIVTDYTNRFRSLKGSDKEVEKREDRLLVNDPGKLYIKGVYVRDIKALFGYDLNMERANPNTGEPDWYAVKARVGTLLTETNSRQVMRTIANYMKNNGNAWMGLLEFDNNAFVKAEHHRAWRKVFKEVYGQRVARFTCPDSTRLIQYEKKGIVLADLPYILQTALPVDTDIRRAKAPRKAEPKVRRKDLEDTSRKNLRRVKRMFENAFNVKIKVKIKELDGRLGLGQYRKWIALDPSVLEDKETCFAIFLHEFVHFYEGHEDLTENFMRAEGRIAGKVFFARKSRIRKKKTT